MDNKALITYGRNRITYFVMKSLHRKGVDVFIADSIPSAICFYSKMCRGKLIYANPKTSQEKFIHDIIKFCRSNSIDIVIPVHEESYVISKYKNKLNDNGIIAPVPDYDSIVKMHDKASLYHLLNKLKIRYPLTYEVTSIDELNKVKKEIKYPAIIKLRRTRGGIGLMKVNNDKELVNKYIEVIKKFNLSPRNYPLIQEYVNGFGVGVEVLYNEGKLKALFVHKRLMEYPPNKGFSILRKGYYHKEAVKYTLKLFNRLKWHGVAMAEFRVDARTNRAYLLEVNPRFWGSLNTAIESGVDFPYLLYKIAKYGDCEKVIKWRTDIEVGYLAGVLLYLLSIPKYIKDGERYNGKIIDKSLLRPWKIVWEDFNLRDPLPFILQFINPLVDYIKYRDLRGQELLEVKHESQQSQ